MTCGNDLTALITPWRRSSRLWRSSSRRCGDGGDRSCYFFAAATALTSALAAAACALAAEAWAAAAVA